MTGKSYHHVLEGYITLPFLNIFQVVIPSPLLLFFFFLGRCIPNILKPPNQTCLVERMASYPRGDTAYRSPIAVNATQGPHRKLEKSMDKQQRLGGSTWKCSVAMANQTSKWPWHHWQEVPFGPPRSISVKRLQVWHYACLSAAQKSFLQKKWIHEQTNYIHTGNVFISLSHSSSVDLPSSNVT